jgi:hypothetical protein
MPPVTACQPEPTAIGADAVVTHGIADWVVAGWKKVENDQGGGLNRGKESRNDAQRFNSHVHLPDSTLSLLLTRALTAGPIVAGDARQA